MTICKPLFWYISFTIVGMSLMNEGKPYTISTDCQSILVQVTQERDLREKELIALRDFERRHIGQPILSDIDEKRLEVLEFQAETSGINFAKTVDLCNYFCTNLIDDLEKKCARK